MGRRTDPRLDHTLMAERFESVDDVTDRLRGADYLADAGISGVVFLADRLEKPVLVEGPAGVGKTERAQGIAGATGARRRPKGRAGEGHPRGLGGPPDPPPVLRGPRRGQGPLRVELQEAAAADP